VSRFDASVTSDTKESGKTVRADFHDPPFEFAEDSDSGEGGFSEEDCSIPPNFVQGFNYVDPRLAEKVLSTNVEPILSQQITSNQVVVVVGVDKQQMQQQQQQPSSPSKVVDPNNETKNRT